MTTQMESRIAALEERVTRLEEHSEEKVIELREITMDEARAEIVDLFAAGETLYYSDIADRLRLDLEMVVEICHKLQEEDVIYVADHAI
ncbi:MAG: hypothetical protein OXG67_06205 [bacterium]|nr:hypothetical protein [bacterium]MCY3890711.1 hypothetical protein [bacterium]